MMLCGMIGGEGGLPHVLWSAGQQVDALAAAQAGMHPDMYWHMTDASLFGAGRSCGYLLPSAGRYNEGESVRAQ